MTSASWLLLLMNWFCTSSQTMNSTSSGSPAAWFSAASTLLAQSLLAGERKKVSKPWAPSLNQLLQCRDMKRSPSLRVGDLRPVRQFQIAVVVAG